MVRSASVRVSALVRLLVVALFLSILTTVQVVTAAAPATAAPVTDFEPGNIISDAVMYDSSSMSAAAVQTFLDARGTSCRAASGSTCVKDYRENTPSRSADTLCTRPYAGGSNETAATIIAKVSVACGINPQVLIVTLQKEQGLITATAGKTARTYARALGFGCPDNVGGWCDPQYAGFANQVYSAAKQLKRYASNPNGYSYRAGRTNTILWHPTTSCGSTQVYIQNQATASLYNYTPYVPNPAALAAGYGSGDRCSSYGNRNFHLYFQSWFGVPENRAPIGTIDAVTSPAGSGTVRVRGWALDLDTTAPVQVHIYIDGAATRAVTADGARPDVDRAYGLGAAHGFDATIPATRGSHSICVYAIDSARGPNSLIGCSDVTVSNQLPRGSLDSVSARPGALQVRGWALDPDTAASINIHIYVDGKNVKVSPAAGSRPDVGRIYSLGDMHGFDVWVPASDGMHTVCIYAMDSTGGPNPKVGCRDVRVVNQAPRGALDIASSPTPGSVTVRGWAFDPDSSSSISAHIYVDGKAATSVTANRPRADVSRVYGVGPNHGFESTLRVRAGDHTICVYAIDSTGGANPRVGCKQVSVANSPTSGAVNPPVVRAATVGGSGVAATRASITVTGWAWDFDSDAPVAVTLVVDGKVVANGQATLSHADVLGATRTDIGYSLTTTAVPGTRSVCVRAVDPTDSAVIELGCSSVTVPNTLPSGVVDAITPSTKSIRVTGWAQDLDTVSSIAVHVRMDGAIVASPVANLPRPDVDRAFGNGPLRGFDVSFPAAPGRHDVCVYAIGSPAGSNPMIRCEAVVVQ